MFARLDGSVRRAVRKAKKCGLTVTISCDHAAMEKFYWLQCLTRRKHGLPPQPFAFFRAIQEEILMKRQGMIVAASSGHRPVAASVYFYRGQCAIYKYGASDQACQQLRGSNLVMWEAIKWLALRGCKTLHLGRTSLSNKGLRRFKLNWGAEESKMDYVKYDFRRNAWITETNHVTGWHNRIFRALPLGASRLIGGVLYRHMA
jgi:lipid II:glycine glycyltransferase (peptidoglycan interpeptide bridge formation enzyme)